MKDKILFSFPDKQKLGKSIAKKTGIEIGELTIREFPDKESFVQIHSDVKNKEVYILCGLDKPNTKVMPLLFLADVCKELGAKKAGLITPYLGYMRQDKRFNSGEAVSSQTFGKIMSNYFDYGMTIDPHLHRYKSMDEVYSFPFDVLHAADTISKWIKENIKNPLLIGPDIESRQWVSDVAKKADAPFLVLRKVRKGDKDVEVSVPHVEKYKNNTPVLVDDIISTARTMIGAVNHLNKAGMNKTVCVGIHAVFSGDAYQVMQDAGVADVVTCNTITHKTNKIDVSDVIAERLNSLD